MYRLTKKYFCRTGLVIWFIIALAANVFSSEIINFTSVQKEIPGCALHYQANHTEVFCSDEWEESNIEKPFVISACGSPAYLAGYEERYYEFGNTKGFSGYFEIDKWNASRINGDGGVDVTGAPIGLQAEGAGNLLVRSRPTDRLQLKIVIPAEGYLSFNWKKSGGSIFVSLILNGEKKQIVSKRDQNGAFFSELLHEGDLFVLEIESQSEFDQDILLEELEFLTNALGVVERNWNAFNLDGANIQFSQFINIIRANLIDVVFPANVKSTEKHTPEQTGYPLLDTDGLFFTTTDRIPIEKGSCQFEVSWSDELITVKERPVLLRHWVVDDHKTGSIIKETQKIFIFTDEDLPPSLSKQAKEVNNSTNSILDSKAIGY
jgi:hypothetical protein